MTIERPWKRTAADAGHDLCPDCHGRGWCWVCDGTGEFTNDRGETRKCIHCAGGGTCLACHGEGQVWVPPYQVRK